ncbi:hypothetical protein niasHT_008909 [Heterodera trifolii]|uniref:Ig-like domain-containing protein n=1 Tax=Heterodera trifolii TaxID=157864 RepID=A0ABD2LY12_9BILA
MKTIWARIGQPITLPCEFESSGGGAVAGSSDQIEWRKNGTLIFNAFGTEPGFFASDYEGRLSRASAMDLTIHSVQLRDQSIFLCSISHFARGKTVGGRENGEMIRLIVNVIPRILEPLDGLKIFVREKGTLRQNCTADGIPSPSIKWSKKTKNGNWRVMSYNRQLIIEQFSADDEGEFNCEAQNFEGTENAIVTIKRRKPLRIDRENASLLNKTAVEGAAVFWHCSVEQRKQWDEGKVRIHWTKGGKAMNAMEIGLRAHFNDEDGSFGIMFLRRTDSGEFECHATLLDSADELLERDSVKVQLNVQYKPEVSPKSRRFYALRSDHPAELECLLEANPLPTLVKWTKNGRPFTEHTEKSIDRNLLRSAVRIPSVNFRESAGIYTCEAENIIGVTEPNLEIHVVVAEAPKFARTPAPKYIVKAGERVEIECEGFGEVPIRRVWSRREDGRHRSFSEAKFSIANAAHSDHGIYCCVLISSVATVSREVQLIVHETAPQCATNFRVQCEGQQRLAAFWMPGYPGGDLSQSFRVFYQQIRNDSLNVANEAWKMIGKRTDQSKLHVDHLEVFGEYEFKLEASNRIGTTNCTIPGTYYTCSKLDRPTNFLLVNSTAGVLILKWDEVKEANSYKIKGRKNCDAKKEGKNNWEEMAQTSGSTYNLSSAKLNLGPDSKCCAELVVQSVRPPFSASEHSSAVILPIGCSVGTLSSNLSSLFLFSLCTIFLLFLLFVLFFFYSLHRGNEKARQKQRSAKNGKNSTEKKQCQKRMSDRRMERRIGQIGMGSAEGTPFGDSFDNDAFAQCAFGHPIAITRKLFPENYICTKFARFDEEEEGEEGSYKSEESFFGRFPNDGVPFLNSFNGIATISENIHRNDENNNSSVNSKSVGTFAENLPSFVAENLVAEKNEGIQKSAVVEMLREKYLFEDAELNVLNELRIEHLRKEMSKNWAER